MKFDSAQGRREFAPALVKRMNWRGNRGLLSLSDPSIPLAGDERFWALLIDNDL
jgi:hypothetical protein